MPKAKVVALEEHFTSPQLRANCAAEKDTPLQRKLDDLGALRLREMDEAGIDLQVISENNPATQNLDAETAVTLARASNDTLHEAVRAHPDALCRLRHAADARSESRGRRTGTRRHQTRLQGRHDHGVDPWPLHGRQAIPPIFARAAALDVPLYIHPTPPHQAVMDAYFKDYPVLAGAPLGFTIETLTHTFRLIVSGLFDEFPALKIIVGHLGETAPFLLWRTNDILSERLKMPKSFRRLLPAAFLAHHQRRVFRYRAHLLDCRDWASSASCFRSTGRSSAISPAAMDGCRPGERRDRALIFGGNAAKLLKL